ncbi:polysaccharide pyruvyl transferase family protein [Klebsiella sp. RHBSTW-00484]|uniref:polysaccharide pyruvyl transferase family protein n=1 Tax=unclassified Klebsiella TaxID=2608929 RepID=UPI0015E4A2F8|nr:MULTISPECIES: polysaccharide pyruvyl transferase family protein [unclassified Klebsiella]QLO36253.1 polysaccharide pyruvyl transferase family protein [Klebsiella sp. RHBSTW-00484]QLT75770.1 polysaccharide pyruvyl transferase family protein [Klebsiella sp. RHBSTW-00464]HDG7825910.1 polysaccharide pyruvyl transferase family protein [Klebsiella quasipneumoniae]
MKIAILTLPLHVNYGGNIQNYSLQRALKNLGHEPVTINCKIRSISPVRKFLSAIKKTLTQSKDKRNYLLTKNEFNSIACNHRNFINQYISITQPVEYSSLSALFDAEHFDAILVGSDQVWRPKYTENIEHYFLDFLEKNKEIKKISYAASFGSELWEYSHEQQRRCQELLRHFNAVSVRESLAVNMCRDNFGISASHVLDPTMLLTKEDYLFLIKDSPLDYNNGKIFNYTLDTSEDKRDFVISISEKLQRDVFFTYPIKTKKQSVFISDIDNYKYPSIESWLNSFHNADFVVTDSFHGTVFSIIFNKPFIALANQARGTARFLSLLELFDLKERLVTDIHGFDDNILYNHIDYNKVNQKLDLLRSDSLRFLIDSLA